jgi:glycosyltransferase involved in cell wall biosynthesis
MIVDTNQEIIACSVCIANYNGENVLETCLDSVFRQDFLHPIEIIVHDDASTDGSAAIVTDKYPNGTLNQERGQCRVLRKQ